MGEIINVPKINDNANKLLIAVFTICPPKFLFALTNLV
ncbi:hypothetical protein CHCC20335_2367 [Bacillus paralicheniformis]|nr:hypothetical protein CHCC20335_2367 [Bacillus paralicheniformis]